VRLSEALLLKRDVTEAPPGIVVRLVCLQCLLVALLTILIIFISDEFVAAESMRVGEVSIELDGASEEFKGRLMLLQQAIAVADHAPGFGCEERLLNGLIAQENKRWLVLQMPQACRVVFEAFESMRLQFAHLFIDFNRLMITALLEHAFGQLALHPSSLLLA